MHSSGRNHCQVKRTANDKTEAGMSCSFEQHQGQCGQSGPNQGEGLEVVAIWTFSQNNRYSRCNGVESASFSAAGQSFAGNYSHLPSSSPPPNCGERGQLPVPKTVPPPLGPGMAPLDPKPWIPSKNLISFQQGSEEAWLLSETSLLPTNWRVIQQLGARRKMVSQALNPSSQNLKCPN